MTQWSDNCEIYVLTKRLHTSLQPKPGFVSGTKTNNKVLNDINYQEDHLDSFGIIQNIQRSPSAQTSNWSGTFFGHPVTVAVWTQNPFTSLLTRLEGSQGSQGCRKIRFFILKIKLLNSCAKINPKVQKLQKTLKIEKKLSKNPVFLDFFKCSSFWGQY